MYRPTPRSALVALLILALPPTTHAQLPHRPSLPTVHIPGGGGGSAAKPVTYDQVTLELTSTRLDAALRAFAVEKREGPRIAADYRQREAAYQVALRQWMARDSARKARAAAASDCYQRTTAGDRTLGAQHAQAMQANANDPRTQARLKDLQARLQAAGQKQDMAAVMALSDSMRQLMGVGGNTSQATTAASDQARGRCGVDSSTAAFQAAASDTEPTAPPNPRDSVATVAAQAGGFTVPQYAMVRERVLGYLSVDPDKLRASSWAFSQGELDALKAHQGQLTAYQPMLASE